MSFRPLEPRLNLEQAEALVRRLPEVSGCRIQAGPGGEIAAVHVSARAGADASRLVRDVVTLLAAEATLDLDAGRVHVVVVPEADPDAGVEALALDPLEREGRVRLVALHASTTDERSSAEVELVWGEQSVRGRAEARGAGTAPELMAQACLDALEKLSSDRVALRLVALQRSAPGAAEIVFVLVQEAEGRSERLHVGAARVEGDLSRAAAYAALDSMNRRLGRILAGPPRLYDIT